MNNTNQINANITNTIKGVPYKGVLPKVGGGAGQSVGSDFYGMEIIEVAADLTWFKMNNGQYAKFDHRKNSIHYGKYVFAYHDENGKLYTNDVFECTDIEIVKYLLNIKKNPAKRAVVKLLEIN